MKRLIVCGMLLGLLTTVSFAQRGRAIGGATAGARIPNVGAISPHAGINPNSVGLPHGGVLPNATTSKTPKTITPNATINPKAGTVRPNSETVRPDRVTLPDAHIGPGSNQ